ncbi:MAG: dTDP-4-dehydrorhamnose reductase [Actinobacteria bacterium]|nr:MAG: dTDP-4-dehydrorhamnose reductase [Actinomycetota bacterium]
MRILLFGGQGMLGSELLRTLIGPGNQVFAPSERETDIADEDAVARSFIDFTPECVIHAAAYTNVDGCELNPHLAFRVNSEGTRHVAKAAGRVGASMLYVSTDFVFDGRKKTPYLPDDRPHPLNVYGHSKLEGEKHVKRLAERHWIVRTAWLFGKNGPNFVRAILDKADRGGELEVVDDQTGSPTYARHLAIAIAEIVGGDDTGTWHVTGGGRCTWYDLARETLALSGREHVPVSPISSVRLGRPARRPPYSVLGNADGPLPFSPLPSWREGLAAYLREMRELRE